VLVLVSFVLVLAAAVTLVVGLLQSGLTLIYLSIACSVLAGVVLAVAVLRGRPEPKPAAVGRAFTPPAREPVSASVGSQQTTSYTPPAPSYTPPAPSYTPPPPPAPSPEPAGDDLATKAAGSALLGRLRGRRGAEAEAPAGVAMPEPEPVATFAPETASEPGPATTEMPVARTSPVADADFPIPDYDRTRAIDLLAELPALDRNQLEAVREREAAGKNRFTIMNRIDALLATKAEPDWEVEDEEWESEGGEPAGEPTVIAAGPVRDEWDEDEDLEGDEVDELVSPAGAFPISGYETLTVGQILPRLSDLDAEELAQVRAREQQGRARGTILDRIDRLAAKSGTRAGAVPMPAAASARRTPARKAPASKAAARRAPAAKAAPPAKAAPAPRPARASKKAPIPAPPAPEPAKAAVRKARATKAVAMPPAAAPVKATRKAPARKAKAAPAAAETPMKSAVKRARKATKKA
jgi:hypothetical protein